MRYTVFIGAPTISSVDEDGSTGYWNVVTDPSQPFPSAALEEASVRLSRLYQGIVFGSEGQDEDISDIDINETDRSIDETGIDWPPTNPAVNRTDRSAKSLLRDTTARSTSQLADSRNSSSDFDSLDQSSIANFPRFRINLHSLTSLSSLPGISPGSRRAVNILAAILEVDGPQYIRLKTGPEAGLEICLLKLIVGDESGSVVKIVTWRQTAELWANVGLRKGDVVLIQNVLLNHIPPALPSLTASPKLNSSLEICYRTLLYTPSDRRFRPDLRLGYMDPGIAKVEKVVGWVQGITGVS